MTKKTKAEETATAQEQKKQIAQTEPYYFDNGRTKIEASSIEEAQKKYLEASR